jgi:hypothetical protein
MAQQGRDRFVTQLKQTAAERKIPIDRLSCRDLPDKDGFELIIEVGGKEQVFTIDEFAAKRTRKERLICSSIRLVIMSKYWRWCARRGARCFNPDCADACSTIGAMRATPKTTWRVRCRITMKPVSYCQDTCKTQPTLAALN